ncbi:hypothetical protein DAEQUDRAFT_815361 [Daedalea quercina L-15889]|uniref:DUF6533 domain-containing protein n=1 Tax=Daedalea quercina L-15889 TaxID=1314783 RepID=A0A165L3W8_9APHY|nr:hypothetical protein DAEQUDRAFT_815361 [Daedalea quercina L-15889]
MSADTLQAAISQDFVENCLTAMTATIYSYDRCITLSKEVDLLWRLRRISLATGLYILLHISAIGYTYTNVATMIATGCKSNYILETIFSFSAVLFHIANGGFMALRAYAISGRSTPLASVVFFFAVLPAALDIYSICMTTTIPAPMPIGCVVTNASERVARTTGITEQASALVAEVLFAVAIWRHASMVKAAGIAQMNTPLTVVLLRDGTLYFVTILVLLITDIALVILDVQCASMRSSTFSSTHFKYSFSPAFFSTCVMRTSLLDVALLAGRHTCLPFVSSALWDPWRVQSPTTRMAPLPKIQTKKTILMIGQRRWKAGTLAMSRTHWTRGSQSVLALLSATSL